MKRWIGGGVILALAALVGVGLWQTSLDRPHPPFALVRHPERVMGTTCTLAAVVPWREQARAEEALRPAEAALRAVEARMSTWLADSEISRLNAAGAGEEVPLPPESREVLHRARQAARDTGGAFDVTCRPLIEVWRQAGKRGRLPTEAELERARAASDRAP